MKRCALLSILRFCMNAICLPRCTSSIEVHARRGLTFFVNSTQQCVNFTAFYLFFCWTYSLFFLFGKCSSPAFSKNVHCPKPKLAVNWVLWLAGRNNLSILGSWMSNLALLIFNAEVGQYFAASLNYLDSLTWFKILFTYIHIYMYNLYFSILADDVPLIFFNIYFFPIFNHLISSLTALVWESGGGGPVGEAEKAEVASVGWTRSWSEMVKMSSSSWVEPRPQ